MSTSAASSRRLRLVLVLALVVLGAGLRARGITDPWTGGHRAWGGAMYGGIARNFVRYGYLTTRLAPVSSSGVVEKSEFEHYYHYAPLLVWLVSLSFHAFGIHEWSARLVPLVFAVLQLPLIYLLGRKLLGEAPGLVALAVLATSPVGVIFGSHVDVYGSLSAFFALAAVAGYAWWAADARRLGACACVAALVAGAATSWHAYFLAAILAGHALFVAKGRASFRMAASLVATVVLVFGLFLAHRAIALPETRGEVHGTLLEKLKQRTSYSGLARNTGEGIVRVGVSGLVYWHVRDAVRLLAPLPVLFTGCWLLQAGARAVRRRLSLGDWIIAALLLHAFVHDLVFPGLVLGHDYLVVAYMTGVALATAVVVVWAMTRLSVRAGTTGRTAALVAATVVTCLPGLVLAERWRGGDLAQARRLEAHGRAIAQRSGERDLVLAPGPEDRILLWYADRRMTFEVDTPEKVAAHPEAALLVMERAEAERHGGLVETLQATARLDVVAHETSPQSPDALLVFSLREPPAESP